MWILYSHHLSIQTSRMPAATPHVASGYCIEHRNSRHRKCYVWHFSESRIIPTGRQEDNSIQKSRNACGVGGGLCVLERMELTDSDHNSHVPVRLTWTGQAFSQRCPGTGCARELGFVSTVLCVCRGVFPEERWHVSGQGVWVCWYCADLRGIASDWDVWACVGR